MNQRRLLASVALGLVLGFGERVADAGLVTWEFGGEITLVDDPDNDLGGAITLGTPFSGSFTFESTTPDSNPESVGFGLYIDAITVVSGHVGAFAFSGESGFISQIRITDSPGGDNDILSASAGSVGFSDIDGVSTFKLLLSNPDGSVFASDALPLFPPDLIGLTLATVSFNFNQSSAFVSGDVRVLVPEPGSLALLAFGALVLARRRRFSRSFVVLAILLILGLGMPAHLHAQQWNPEWGPVIIGGDDLDDHRTTIGALFVGHCPTSAGWITLRLAVPDLTGLDRHATRPARHVVGK